MPPRHAYWTIIVDGTATAFRAAVPDDLLATLNRLKETHASAEMRWFQAGRLWASKDEAHTKLREGYRVGKDGELIPPEGRGRRDPGWRPGGTHRDPREKYQIAKKAKWTRFKEKIRGGPKTPRTGEPPWKDHGGAAAKGPRGPFRPKGPSSPSGDAKERRGPRAHGFGPDGARPKGPVSGTRAPWKPRGPGGPPWKASGGHAARGPGRFTTRKPEGGAPRPSGPRRPPLPPKPRKRDEDDD